MPTSIRLEEDTKTALEEIARRRGTTRSQLVRSAIDDLIQREKGTAFERVEDLIGCVDSGPTDLSTATGKKFRELLEKRRR